MQYRRLCQKGGCYFFTLVTYQRARLFDVPQNVARLEDAFRHVRAKRPFAIDAIVVLPDHLHCVMHLPEGDDDFATRWRLIKHYFSRGVVRTDHWFWRSRHSRGEVGVWQRRYWEHLIRDDDDWRRHVDYVHYNPVKHGLALRPVDWPYSSFRGAVARGWYEPGWGAGEPQVIRGAEWE